MEQSGTALLLEQICNHHEDNIMPLGAFKAALMGTAGVSTGDVVLLHDQDYSSVTQATITSGIDSTYGEYIFRFYNLNPETDGTSFTFNCSTDGGSNYNMAKASIAWLAQHAEDDSPADVGYQTGMDLPTGGSNAGVTNHQILAQYVGDDADQCAAGELHLFTPSSTTYVKHWYSRMSVSFDQNGSSDPRAQDVFTGGYVNSTSDVDAVEFKMAAGDFDGTIKMWGVK